MAGEIYLRDDGDVALGCISDDLAAVVLCVLEWTIMLSVILATIAADDGFITLCCNG